MSSDQAQGSTWLNQTFGICRSSAVLGDQEACAPCRLICQEQTYLTLFHLEGPSRTVKYYTEGKRKKDNWAMFSGQRALDLPTLAPKSIWKLLWPSQPACYPCAPVVMCTEHTCITDSARWSSLTDPVQHSGFSTLLLPFNKKRTPLVHAGFLVSRRCAACWAMWLRHFHKAHKAGTHCRSSTREVEEQLQ